MAAWKKIKPSRIPISLQTMLIAAAGLIVAGAISVFGSAYAVNRLKNQMAEAARSHTRRMLDRAGAEIARIIHERGVSTLMDVADDPEIKRVIDLIADESTVISIELYDADGYRIREQHYESRMKRSGEVSRIYFSSPQNSSESVKAEAPADDYMSMTISILSGKYVRGQIKVGMSPGLAMGGVQTLSDQISHNLQMMVTNVIAILLLTIIIVYYAFRRQMELQRRTAEAEHFANLGTLAGGLAHEIRNPLHAMNLHLEAVREDLEEAPAGNQDAAQAIARVQRQIENMNALVSNFLNLAIPGRVELQEMRLDQKVQEIVTFLQPEFDARGIALSLNLPGGMTIRGDAHALHQVIMNLLINARHALEGSTGGRVAIRAERDRKHWRVIVEDSGAGIPAGEEENIFKAFVSKRSGGTGFGLYIARMIMERHGGRIFAGRSESLGGALFCLEFPERPAHDAVSQPTPATVG